MTTAELEIGVNDLTKTEPRPSPRQNARIAGVFWLLCIVTGVFSFAITFPMIVWGNAAATAANLSAKESLFRLASLANVISGACYLGATALLYSLFRPVSRSLSFAGACFGVAGVALGGVSYVAGFAPFVLLRGDQAFTASQWQSLTMAALALQVQVFSIGMIFFGVQCIVIGYMIVQSTFLPKILGILLACGGMSYVVSSCANLLAPRLGAHLVPLVMPVALVGEGALTLWLLARGVNEQRWNEQASKGPGRR